MGASRVPRDCHGLLDFGRDQESSVPGESGHGGPIHGPILGQRAENDRVVELGAAVLSLEERELGVVAIAEFATARQCPWRHRSRARRRREDSPCRRCAAPAST